MEIKKRGDRGKRFTEKCAVAIWPFIDPFAILVAVFCLGYGLFANALMCRERVDGRLI